MLVSLELVGGICNSPFNVTVTPSELSSPSAKSNYFHLVSIIYM